VKLNGLGQDATVDPASGLFFGTGQTDVTSPVDATMQQPDTLVDSDDPSKYFTTAYYANQIAQFQQTLIQLDQTAQALETLAASPSIAAADLAAIQAWIADYDGKKWEIQAAAATVNGIVNTANVFGVGLPNITVPQTLQLAPLAIVGIAAAVVAITSIVSWAAEKIITAQQLTQQLLSLPPDQRAAALARIEAANPSTLSSVSTIVKWVAIGALIFFGYKAWREYQGGRSLAHSFAGDE
jgi:hypothetical protein